MSDADWVDDTESDDGWVDDPQEKHGALDTGIMHGLQGASAGFLDELSGVGEAAGRAIGVKGMGGKFSDLELQSPDFEFSKNYEEGRDAKRALLAAQREQNPGAAFTGSVAGSIASPLNKLAGVTSLTKAGLGIGAANGLGNSEADNVVDMAKDTGIGAGIGLAGGKLASAVKGAAPTIQNTVDDIATAPLGVSAPRGVLANVLDKSHRVGRAGNKAVDNLVESITPSTGDAVSDKVAGSIAKGLGKAARYGFAGKAQAGLDTLEQAPKAIQWAAGKASPMLQKAGEKIAPHADGALTRTSSGGQGAYDFLSGIPRFKALADKNPKAFESLAGDFSKKYDPTKPVSDEEAKESFLEGN